VELKEFLIIERNDEEIKFDFNIKDLKNHVQSGNPAIIRGFFSEEECRELIKFSIGFSKTEDVSCPTVSANTPNYHRIDNNIEKSKVKSILHLFTYFYWNKESQPVAKFFKRLFRLRNLISNLPENYALENLEDDMISIPIVQQYPSGGGYMQEHMDPSIGQKVVFSVLLSKFSRDFFSGGLFFRNEKNEKIYVDSKLNPGDAFVFHPNTRHGVDPIDPENKLDWNNFHGRWMCFSALVNVKTLNGQDVDASSASKAMIY
jgi:hypothetical protein